ncbi:MULTISPECIES: class I SAM-dependent methyltransferase [Dyella]|uniref:Class I SAM-dependent methyltransferase n=2 Tax=Dyella TaxID=231454 RepID=A0A4R0YZM2_9GAMM|nr:MULTISPECIES: class I SAM-dependent methyltransferase [Dyella]TBR40140.1 class I SAM-dependent methyltransferase [Dyella terrae]TCI12276.1 class I SAM-dependent methyltransferase [Dyella soli]
MYPERRTTHNWLIKKRINDLIAATLPSVRGVVLDLGCGPKPFGEDFLSVADHYYGIDWANSLHEFRGDVLADLNRPLPIASESIDNVVSLEVIEHLKEPQVMMREAERILKRGGQFIVSAPFQWWVHEAPWDYQRFTRYGLEYQLSKAGFVDISVQATTGFWSMWLLKLNYQTLRLVRGPLLVRRIARSLLVPFWWLNQMAGRLLDAISHDDRETAGYFATARKP